MNVSGGFTTFDRMLCEPIVVGYMPVTSPDRLGAHTGVWVYARVNRAPSRARRSMFGVIACASPYDPSVGLASSSTIHTMFGGDGGGICAWPVMASQAAPTRMSAANRVVTPGV